MLKLIVHLERPILTRLYWAVKVIYRALIFQARAEHYKHLKTPFRDVVLQMCGAEPRRDCI